MLPKTYEPQNYEKEIYKKWGDNKVFSPDTTKIKTHINVLPPPNANGALHLGHASGYAIMDIAGRYARMQGKNTLLLPGKDHAGILTQTVFERKLLKEQGIDRHDLGREEFYKQCYDFCIESSEMMRSQEKRIGLSADWDREKFTLDPEISKAVLETFVQMYKEGLAYRGERIINWCPNCQTAISDMEVEHKESEGFLWQLKYPIKDSNDFITVETTRPETMLGDTAVAVHPKDKRYKDLIGRTVILPIVNREIKIISDNDVDMGFGSGAVKVTPSHDPLDYKIGQRNKLEEITVIGFNGKMTEISGKEFNGLTIIEAREKVIEKFRELNLLGEIKKHTKPLSLHDRCGHIIEPLISKQWWINTDHKDRSLKKDAIKVIKEGKIKIVPKNFEKTFFHWMDNLQDWCISRQLWWGHQIPAYYCGDCENMDVTLGEKTEIYYMRHGETDLNKKEIWQGKTEDATLNETGRKQIEKKVKEIKEINPYIIISSPLIRAKESAEIISKGLGNVEVVIEKGLHERDYGDYSGMLDSKVKELENIKHASEMHFRDFPNGESFEDCSKRLKKVFDNIEEKYRGKKVLIVAHGGILRVLRKTEKKMTVEAAVAYKGVNGHIEKFTRYTPHTKCTKCGSKNIKQDPDTFDTWFSSGQWAHNTLFPFGEGKYFPSDLMVMGRDILFFWACRMIMMSLYVKKDIPFKTLYLTGLITDKDGKKMSKSKGNGIDPLDMCDKYGTDALRLSLFIGNSPGNDMRLYEEKIAGYRNFINKLWNAARFVQMSADNKPQRFQEPLGLNEVDKWILSRTNKLVKEVTESLENYKYSEAGQKLYDFTWNEFCDWYIELSKGEKQNIKVLNEVLETLLILLHPFIPFVTETLWKELNFSHSEFDSEFMLATYTYPAYKKEWDYDASEKNIELLIEIVSTIRSLRADKKIEPVKKIDSVIHINEENLEFIKNSKEEIIRLSRLEKLDILSLNAGEITQSRLQENSISQIISDGIIIELPLSGMINLKEEKLRLEKELQEAEKSLANLENRLANKGYLSKAPSNLVEQTKKEKIETEEKIEKIKDQINSLK